MPFESLSYRHTFVLSDFPDRWLPLIHLYDADLPLFPIYYFHAISRELPAGQRPTASERVYGYVEKINSVSNRSVEIHLVTNKNLGEPANQHYRILAEGEVCERLGVNNPVTQADVTNAFQPPLAYANPVLVEIWNRVVAHAYGNVLPFGRLWDEVLGLTRFVASWNSPGGRKGELIQTHYFSSKYGEPIQSAGGIPDVDFYLLPTISELMESANPLNIFPRYTGLVEVAELFQQHYCTLVHVGGIQLSKFTNPGIGQLNTAGILGLLGSAHIPYSLRPVATECFNTFDKGPHRTVIFLMMLSDLRSGRLNPATLSNSTLGSMYAGLEKTYQSPKVLHIYAQQSFGNTAAIPLDTWMETFFQWPLNLYKNFPKKTRSSDVISASTNLGKVERLLWVTAQARKVHSSACNDALWCTKYASNRGPRGANPLACKICLSSIRNSCPAHADIKEMEIVFNTPASADQFEIRTSSNNNTTPNQTFVSCQGPSIYCEIVDDFSPADDPNGYAPYPSAQHNGAPMSVSDFISKY